ncbi:hypothetical protein CLAFUW4_08066 [Fulvia fulva]|uniref:Uncharacterized protein n=1 Tax=Passalora fulva TaxID=5499 RepID=A0A9Q8LDP3_PASFU|nr:uncharacterized protein CLAFUR5_08184 [Fulvia fulva]KAK4629315.1 hypothetical protein CLAFUR4_08071 [Fulvia fulva]KAK4629892.1 hypothetical protein CLAFUR0_08066 [Fulvia fulva]UJO15651.1 hypothetical protein CLAFUR5_08184 [Fulvia fulva]WPV12296.1 hypothetical protein CLAFUW4_08066 [Fulvia fulva]WPV27486.1 hypothetical protein CLAFUW7_08066 [Fulvia fulva]
MACTGGIVAFYIVGAFCFGLLLYVLCEFHKSELIEREFVWRHCRKKFLKMVVEGLRDDDQRLDPTSDPPRRERELEAKRDVLVLRQKLNQTIASHRAQLADFARELAK